MQFYKTYSRYNWVKGRPLESESNLWNVINDLISSDILLVQRF